MWKQELKEGLEDQPWFPLELIDVPDESENIHLVDYVEGVPVAFGLIRGFDEGWDDKCLGIAVHKDFRGQGYGYRMLDKIIGISKNLGLTQLRLHVHPDNKAAIKLYMGMEFRKKGTRDNGEWIMYKNLYSSRVRSGTQRTSTDSKKDGESS